MKRAFLVGALLLPAAAQAYLLSAGAILRKSAAHREDLEIKSMVVQGTLTLYGQEAKAASAALRLPEVAPLNLAATASYRMPGKCRLDVQLPSGGEAANAANVTGDLRLGGADLASVRRFAAFACPMLDGRGGSDGLTAFARGSGVDLARVYLGRIDGTVAYVLGGKPRDTAASTLWIEKDRWAPLRVVTVDGKERVDVRMVDFASAVGGEAHPRVVEIRAAGELTARFSAEKVETNVPVSDAIF